MRKPSIPTTNFMTGLGGAGRSRPSAAEPTVDNRPPEAMDPAHRAGVERALERAKRREFATDVEVEAAYRRFRPA